MSGIFGSYEGNSMLELEGNGVYLTCLDTSATGSRAFVGSTTGKVHLYDAKYNMLSSSIQAHKHMVTSVSVCAWNPSLVMSSSRDGTVLISDTRTGTATTTLRVSKSHRDADVNCVAGNASGVCLVAGCGSYSRVADLRKNQFTVRLESHSGNVTSVLFEDPESATFFTAAEDGLVCMFRLTQLKANETVTKDPLQENRGMLPLTEENDEDSGMDEDPNHPQIIMSMDTPVSRMAMMGDNKEGLAVTTSHNQFGLFLWRNAYKVGVNQDLNVHPSLVVDESWGYLLRPQWCPEAHEMVVLGGSSSGTVSLFQLDSMGVLKSDAQFVTSNNVTHNELIRDSKFINDQCFTVGEDGLICVWKKNANIQSNNAAGNAPVNTPF